MTLALAAVLALSAPSSAAACSWDRPGLDPFRGDLVQAVDRYTDIPVAVRQTLKRRMAARQYDEIASIRRDSIEGRYRYGAELRGMHFGDGRVCNTTTRSGWSANHVERGLVYCESGHCLIVPTVCRNLSRVTRAPQDAVAGAEDTRQPAVPGLQAASLGVNVPALDAVPGLGPAAGQTAAAADALIAPGGASWGGGGSSNDGQASFAALSNWGSPTIGMGGGFNRFSGDGTTELPSSQRPGNSAPLGDLELKPAAQEPGRDLGLGDAVLPDPGLPTIDLEVTPSIPEPGTFALWALGLLAVAGIAKRQRTR